MLAKEEKNLELTKVVPFQIFLLVPAISCLPSLAIDLAILTSFLLCHLIHFLCSISHCCCRPSTKELQLSRSKKLRNAGTAKRERNKETMVSFFFFCFRSTCPNLFLVAVEWCRMWTDHIKCDFDSPFLIANQSVQSLFICFLQSIVLTILRILSFMVYWRLLQA